MKVSGSIVCSLVTTRLPKWEVAKYHSLITLLQRFPMEEEDPTSKKNSAELSTLLFHVVMQHSNSDTVVYVGCGERGNEMAEVCDVYVSYGFSSIDKDIA
ncbi:hypothetical protein Syun_015132 [Stephania yunnanensis]|uniref:Uncharacterized protein n=1 Tax=Stephania yunnanensis TaxID=152371 RepID=A0AAP0P9E9_9MAGN